MLGHEGSVFALAAMGLLLVIRKQVPEPKFVGAAILCFILAMAPWWWYQRWYDPPGDRLLKYHLANAQAPTREPFLPLMVTSYRQLGLEHVIEYKLTNVAQLVDSPDVKRPTGIFAGQIGNGDLVHDAAAIAFAAWTPRGSAMLIAAARLRSDLFFEFFPGLGIMAFGPLALVRGWRRRRSGRSPPEAEAARAAWAIVPLALVIWCLVMFGPAMTVPHQGTYAVALFALAGSILAFWSLDRRIAYAACGLQVALNGLLYVALTPEPGPLLSEFTSGFNPYLALFTVVAGAALIGLLASMAQSRPDATTREDKTREADVSSAASRAP
jgi:hypothetical protein